MTRRTRTFADMTDADVVRRRSPATTGSTPDVGDRPARRTRCSRSSTRATWRSCASARARSTPSCGSTDAHAAACSRATARGRAPARRSPTASELREFRVLADLADQRTSVERHRLGRGGQDARSTSAPTTACVGGELGGGDSGRASCSRRFGERKDDRRPHRAADRRRGAGPGRGAAQAPRAALRRRPRRPRRPQPGLRVGRDRRRSRRSGRCSTAVLRRRRHATSSTARTGCAPSSRVERPGWGQSRHEPALATSCSRCTTARHAPLGGRWYGVYPALVTDIKDPDGQGRVKVTLPWSPDGAGSAVRGLGAARDADGRATTAAAGSSPTSATRCWSRSRAATRAGRTCSAGCGTAPTRRPRRWTAPAATTRRCSSRATASRSRSTTPTARSSSSWRRPAARRSRSRTARASIEIEDATATRSSSRASGITVTAAAKVTVNAATAEISAATLTVNAGMSKFSGVVQADTVITNRASSAHVHARRGEHLVSAHAGPVGDAPRRCGRTR